MIRFSFFFTPARMLSRCFPLLRPRRRLTCELSSRFSHRSKEAFADWARHDDAQDYFCELDGEDPLTFDLPDLWSETTMATLSYASLPCTLKYHNLKFPHHVPLDARDLMTSWPLDRLTSWPLDLMTSSAALQEKQLNYQHVFVVVLPCWWNERHTASSPLTVFCVCVCVSVCVC